MNRIHLKQTLVAVALYGVLATAAQAAAVETIWGRGAPVGHVAVERVLISGTHVQKVLGRSGQVAIGNSTARFAKGDGTRHVSGGDAVSRRLGRA